MAHAYPVDNLMQKVGTAQNLVGSATDAIDVDATPAAIAASDAGVAAMEALQEFYNKLAAMQDPE